MASKVQARFVPLEAGFPHRTAYRRSPFKAGYAAAVAFDMADKLRDDNANLQKAYDDIRVKYMRLTT